MSQKPSNNVINLCAAIQVRELNNLELSNFVWYFQRYGDYVSDEEDEIKKACMREYNRRVELGKMDDYFAINK